MLGHKVYAQKQGAVHTVYVDVSTGQPMQVSSPDQVPPGGFPYTFLSSGEVRAKFPGRELVILEKPTPPQRVLRKSAEVSNAVSALLSEHNVLPVDVKQPTPQTTPHVTPNNDARFEHAKEFLKRIQYAMEYASEENRAILSIQVEIVEDLIEEVFKV